MNDRSRPWEHPAVSGKHVVSMTRDYPDGVAWSVATCQCGWTARELVSEVSARWKRSEIDGTDPRDDAVYAHWRGVIAAAIGAPA